MLGSRAEEIAVQFLINRGWQVIHRNFATRRGEIDVIALKEDVLAFVEVKSGRKGGYGVPAQRVGAVKQRRLILAAEEFLLTHPTEADSIRFDVIELSPSREEEWKITQIEDAFRAG